MKHCHKLPLAFLGVVLGSCASVPNMPAGDTGETVIKTLQVMLPGAYSNFAQIHDSGTDAVVTDIGIRQLKTSGETVFLFTSELRDQGVASYDLYWLKIDRATRQAAFHFTRLTEDELSLPMQDTLSIARQRVVPGCALLPLTRAGDRFEGRTNPDTCVFTHPLQGSTRLSRSLSISSDALTIQNRLEGADGSLSGDEAPLVLQKHRGYVGWASIRLGQDTAQDVPTEWRLSLVFNTRDDGRVSQLYDQKMESMGFGLQLARLQRFEGEPAYFKMSVINLASGQIQAYKWFEPESGNLNLNLDWFQANLEPIDPADAPP